MPIEEVLYAPCHLPCPNCEKLMRLVAIDVLPSVEGYDKITYHCGSCNCREEHMVSFDAPPHSPICREPISRTR